MTTRPQPEPHLDPHLDPDQIAAFAEGALPASERALCLQHLAECVHCREVAFLAGASLPEREAAPAARRFSFAWWPVLSLGAAALAAIVITVVLLHHPHQSMESTPVQMASQSSVASPLATTAPAVNQPPPAQPKPHALPKPSPALEDAAKSQAPLAADRVVSDAALKAAPAPPAPVAGTSQQQSANKGISGGVAPLTMTAPAAAAPQDQADAAAKAAPTAALRTYSQAYLRSPDGSAGITGAVTDSAGAAIPHAKVALDQAPGTTHRETFTDAAGHFNIGSLQPGKYRLEISSPGFLAQVRDVEVGTSQLAQVDSKLSVGAVSETVEVRAAAPVMNTEAASLQTELPGKQPLQTSVTNGTRTLALDAAGKLFLSKKAGKHWKAVHGPWKKSTITSLSLTTDHSFKVTTAEGAWLSTDGEHWRSTN